MQKEMGAFVFSSSYLRRSSFAPVEANDTIAGNGLTPTKMRLTQIVCIMFYVHVQPSIKLREFVKKFTLPSNGNKRSTNNQIISELYRARFYVSSFMFISSFN